MRSPVLLDTHAWIWFAAGEEKRFQKRAWREINAACQRGECHVSVISVWEVGMLAAKGRLELTLPVGEWTQRALADLSFTPLSREVAVDSSFLPGPFHGDPADRLLVATARHLQAHFATADAKIIDFGRRHHLPLVVC
ncbi:MAG: type II toxin-antitoxin system VapC family toxin [Bryobacteraceae bacterium]|nr:type II toxin-antitoxin system VapC family toxin [Bryobacteraceae bacterium]